MARRGPLHTASSAYVDSRSQTGATRAGVAAWMRINATEHVDPDTGELNLTGLVEAAADHFGALEVLDDDTHWIWDLPIEIGQALHLRLPGDP